MALTAVKKTFPLARNVREAVLCEGFFAGIAASAVTKAAESDCQRCAGFEVRFSRRQLAVVVARDGRIFLVPSYSVFYRNLRDKSVESWFLLCVKLSCTLLFGRKGFCDDDRSCGSLHNTAEGNRRCDVHSASSTPFFSLASIPFVSNSFDLVEFTICRKIVKFVKSCTARGSSKSSNCGEPTIYCAQVTFFCFLPCTAFVTQQLTLRLCHKCQKPQCSKSKRQKSGPRRRQVNTQFVGIKVP